MPKPQGHLGSKDEQAIIRARLGPYYTFAQTLGVLPWIYAVIGLIVYRNVWIAIWALLLSFQFHVFVTVYFASRAKFALEHCKAKSAGSRWAGMFIFRALAAHVIMMSSLIWLGWLWLFGAGAIIYLIETIVTLGTLRQQGCVTDTDLQNGPDKTGPEGK
jgi:hypothetical protein